MLRLQLPMMLALVASCAVASAAGWKPADSPMLTRWAKDVRPAAPWPEYPRPQMVRDAWVNLNGLWDFAVTARDADRPEAFDRQILVPFAPEAALSGVGRLTEEADALWYRRTFAAPGRPPGGRILLHFGAVDWHATVFVNGRRVGEHQGGYVPFSFDITGALVDGRDQELVVRAYDPTDAGRQPHGKQSLKPSRCFYTRVSGIWQTVWIEPVPAVHVAGVLAEPRASLDGVSVTVQAAGAQAPVPVAVALTDGDQTVAEARGRTGEPITLEIGPPKLWSPQAPFLYGLTVRLDGGDRVESYAALRTIAVRQDERGINRLFLNGRPLFQYGPLDQGWWPDGLYTAPTDEALRFDVEAMKRMGFNAVRKHVKVEPARWYTWCDRLGLMVWQDVPNARNGGDEARANFWNEAKAIVEALRPFPSIIMWVPFNEGWGQEAIGLAESRKVVDWIAQRDPTRLVDGGSGWTDVGGGHVLDMHAYPGPAMPPLQPDRACVLGEFGGTGLPVRGHTWLAHGDAKDLGQAYRLRGTYRDLMWKLDLFRGMGLAAAVYTQITDVEDELNGFMTYDRALGKFGEAWLDRLHARLYEPPPRVQLLAGGREPWRCRMDDPGPDWESAETDAASWKTALGPFGADCRNVLVSTRWDAPGLWLRRDFQYDGKADEVYLCTWAIRGASVEVRLNGTAVPECEGTTGEWYHVVPLTKRGLVRPGRNRLAVKAVRLPADPDGEPAVVDVRLLAATGERFGQAKVIVPSAADVEEAAAPVWRYTTERPPDAWMQPAFDDSAWREGKAGFGAPGTVGAIVRSEWRTKDIWIRRAFTLDGPRPAAPALRVYHDEDADVYLNGRRVAELTGFSARYVTVPLPEASVLERGRNVLAIHCRQTLGGQCIDAGLVDEEAP